MPWSRLRLNRPAASAEPVEPPDTSACARPSATALAAWTIEASGVDRTANAGSAALAIDTGASTTSTPCGTAPISAWGPNRMTPMPRSAACAAPAATSRGPRSAPPASTATVIIGLPSGELVAGIGGDDFTSLVVPAHRADAMRKPGAVTLRTRVRGRGADLVLCPALRRAGVRLLLLRDGHRAECSCQSVRPPDRTGPLVEPNLRQLGPARVGRALVPVLGSLEVQVGAAHRT